MNDDLIGRGQTDCEQETVFSPLTYIEDQYHKRPSCYHVETFYGLDNIPEDRDALGDDG